MTVTPITPQEVAEYKAKIFPSFVLEAFNELIAKDFVKSRATVKQKDAIDLIMQKAGDALESKQDVFNHGYLNVEEIYRKAGWKVVYDKPRILRNIRRIFRV